MNNELEKRIITSIFLFISVIFCIMMHQFTFIFLISVILYICYKEWSSINIKYFHSKRRKKNNNYFYIKTYGIIYLSFVWFSALSLRNSSFETAIFFVVILSICACSDIGGYIFGKTIGGKKLIKISPNKTISGSIGSFIFSILPIYVLNLQNYLDFNFDLTLKNFLLSLLISLFCQLGDLIISFFKRLNKVKDTGNILPGHGGLLDRVDGIIFAIPIVYILKTIQLF